MSFASLILSSPPSLLSVRVSLTIGSGMLAGVGMSDVLDFSQVSEVASLTSAIVDTSAVRDFPSDTHDRLGVPGVREACRRRGEEELPLASAIAVIESRVMGEEERHRLTRICVKRETG